MALSSVAILFIVLLVMLTIYFIVGSVVRYRSGLHHCPEILPNYRVWCKLLNGVVRVLTCGKYRGVIGYDMTDNGLIWSAVGTPGVMNGNNVNSINGVGGGVVAVPGRSLLSAREVRFETLVSDTEYDVDDRRATQPAEIIVKYEKHLQSRI